MDIQNNSIVTDADTEILDGEIDQISSYLSETHYFDGAQEEELEMLVAKAMKLGELYERKKWQAAKAHEAKKLEGCVVVPESELKDTFYWPDSEYVVDCPFDYDFELDKGEIQAIEKWQRTKSTKIYFANIYKDDESFEITEFQSLEEAKDAVKENNAYLEAQEFFNLAEAARGGNE